MSRDLQILTGIAALILGFWLLHNAFEGTGKPKPFWTHFLPGM